MEALGITASVIAITQLAGEVASMGYSYIGRVKQAPKEVSELVDELNSLKEALLALTDYIKDASESSVIQKLSGPIQGCRQDLGILQGKLKPRKGFMEVIGRFKWPMRDGEIAKAMSRIERHKTLFLLALSMDQMLHAKENKKYAEDTYHMVSNIKARSENWRKDEEDFWKEGKRIKVLDWLTKENFEKKHIEIRNKRQEGTGEWLLMTPQFEEWFRKGCSLLWGFGIPGAGKTFLSSAVIDHLQKKVIVAYIYFDYKEEEQQRPIHVLESLVKQLASQLQDLPKGIETLHDNLERERRRPTIDELNQALLKIFDSASGKVFLVFDALDECDRNGQRKELLPLLHSMAKGCGVFVTSRQHPEDIQESFHDSAKIRLSADENDIKRYIEHTIDGNNRARRLVEQGNCRARIVSELVDCASGMFLLAHFHIEHLCQQTTAKQILSALDRLKISSTGKSPLDPTYDRAMKTLLNQPKSCADLGLMVLSWLVKSKRALKTEELRLAVSVKQDQYELDELDLPDKTTILDVCAGFVIVDEQSDTIRLVHYTVQEYLKNNPTVSQDADFRVAMTCTTFLSFSIFAQDIPTPYSSPQKWIAYHPFLRYAAIHLSSHLKSCDENLTTDLVLRFISSPNCIDNYLRFIMRCRDYYNYQRLLMWDCRKSTSQKLQPLHLASYLGHLPTVQSLLEKESLPRHEPGMWTPLHFAACEGWEKVVLLLLDYGVGCSIGDRFGQTPLHIAASEGHKAVVEVLLEKGADLSIKDFRGRTALDLTLKYRFVEVARVLLGRGAKPGTTALFDAASDGQEAIVEVLLESNADITARDTKGDTVLHLAVREGYVSLVRLLLDKGAKSSTLNECGNTALHIAVFEGHKEVVQLLLEDAEAETAVLVPNNTGETALHHAALRGDERSVRLLLDKGAKHSAPNSHGDTPLHNALSRGYGMIVELLLDSGADSYDVSNCYGITPLQLAASKGNLTFVESFLARGANLSKSDDYGDTALSSAAAMGHKEVVELLLGKDADLSLRNKLGNTALHKAALRGHKAVIQLLLKNGADWSVRNANGDTAIHLAASNGHVAAVQLLLDSSGEVEWIVQNNGGDTALHQAASEGKHRVLKVLLETGVDFPVVKNKFGSTALHYAAWSGHRICLQLLLERGFNPSVQDKHGNTALHTAARRGNPVIAEALLENGVDSSVQNKDGDTALHYAAWNGCVPVVELLLKKGTNPFVSNNRRNTPLHIAVGCENFVVGRILYEVLRARAREESAIRTLAE